MENNGQWKWMAGAMISLIVTGCGGDKNPSIVFNQLDPVKLLSATSGVQVHVYSTDNTFNEKEGYAWREWTFTLSGKDATSARSFHVALEKYLSNISQGRLNTLRVMTERSVPHTEPLHSELMFNLGRRHGEMHTWLSPGPSGKTCNGVMYLREESLR